MTVTTHQSGATCPSCGRFVGPVEKCPYCGADIRKRIPLRFLRLACLVLAVLGVGILVFAASGAATPVTKIGNIGATMNYAYVRVAGTVTRGPLYDPNAQSLRFYVADDSGEIQAGAFRDVTQQLIAAGKIPTAGDKVSMEGTLRVRDDFTSFNLSSADKVQIVPPTGREIKISDIGSDEEWTYVKVRGDVRDIRAPYQGLTLITVGDASSEVDVAVSGDIETLYGALPAFELGDSVEVQGVVTFFRDSPQLVLRHPRDFKKLDVANTAATNIHIGDIDASRVNQRVQVAGQVTRVSKFSQGVRATLADASGEIALVLWQDVYDQIPNASALQKGAQVQALGKVSEYRGEFEIQPQRASDVKISAAVAQQGGTAAPDATASPQNTAAPSATPRPTRAPPTAPAARTIGSLTPADKDATVMVNGAITRASPFSQGMRYTLDDGTGTMILLLWSNVLEKIDNRAELKPGAHVRVTGKLDVFNDALEVIPANARDVELTAAAPPVKIETRRIGALSAMDVDQVVQVQGTITDLADFSKGKYVTLQDDSGEIQITVFSNILEPVQDKLALGAAASARGKVNLFRGKLEIVADELVIE
jgi:DNA/RNA endonuclease YhcR with UshA esterase domain